jgi:phosphoribosylformylglycinamidine synthase
VRFHSRYDGNCLVNAMAVGLAESDKIFYAAASGVGMPIVYLGSKTGRDGIHGASMASAEFGEGAEEKRPTVQVGDPFAEKLLLEACLEIMAKDCVIAIQDMGAAGLTCSAVEMGAKGDLGVTLDLDAGAVPRDRHERLRDDAVREPGAHAHGASARERERGRSDLPQMGARFRDRRRDHADQALHCAPWRRRDGGSADQGTGDEAPVYKRPFTTRPKTRGRQGPRRQAAGCSGGRAGAADWLARTLLQTLGLGAVRPRHSRQHRAAAGR